MKNPTRAEMEALGATVKDLYPKLELKLSPADFLAFDDPLTALRDMLWTFSRINLDAYCPQGNMYVTGFDPFNPWVESTFETDEHTTEDDS